MLSPCARQWFDKFLTIRMEGKDFMPTTENMKEALEKAVKDKAKAELEKSKKALGAATGVDVSGVDVAGAVDEASKDVEKGSDEKGSDEKGGDITA